jgi:hypothetical protein
VDPCWLFSFTAMTGIFTPAYSVSKRTGSDGLLYTPGRGLTGWDWFWVVIAALLDIGHWAAGATKRNQLPGRRASTA